MLWPILVHGVSIGIILQVIKELRVETVERMASQFQVPAPERFSFKYPEEWPKWIRRFKRYRLASGLN